MRIAARTINLSVAMYLMLSTVCRADVAPQYPDTTWGRDQAPSHITIIVVGAAVSAAIVTLGLFLSRPSHTTTRKKVTIGLLGLVLLAVLGFTVRTYWQAGQDRDLWGQWKEEQRRRRSNWQGPPQYRASPQPATPETTPD